VTVARGVSVSISPSDNSGANGATLTYTVTVNNTGNVSDNYSLTPTDNALPTWSPIVLPTSLVVAAFSSDNATLSVTVPSDAIGGTIDTITVIATSQTDNTVSGSGSCTAKLTIARSVSVSISPSSKSGANGATLTYTVTVSNTGNVSDTYTFKNTDTTGWTKSLSNTSLVVAAFSSDNATLSVTVPSNAIGGTTDTITVIATSQTDNTVSGSGSCTAKLTIARSVSVSISPSSKSGANGATLTYTVTVSNTGNVSDTYTFKNTDTTGWTKSLSNTSLVVAAFSSGNATLGVTIPSNAIGGTSDNITVTATGTGVSGSASCTAQVNIARSVSVSISPASQSGFNGATLTYTVTVSNTGNVSDNYSLAVTDNSGWSENVSPTSLVVAAFGSDNATLSVTVPSNAIDGMINIITVTATSQADNKVSGSASCTAQAIMIFKAIQILGAPWDIGVLESTEIAISDNYTVRNIGNVPVQVLISGDNARSAPGEPVTMWTLSSIGAIGVDTYAMWFDGTPLPPKPSDALLATLAPIEETTFRLKLQAPDIITKTARMSTTVTLRVI
jgi:hypothetical protein